MDFISNPFRGPPNIPHVNEEFFSSIFIGSNLALVMLCNPGRILGSEVRPRNFSRDRIMNICDENAVKRQWKRGEVPKFRFHRPEYTTETWQRMWDKHLHWKRWSLEREGPCFSAVR